MTKQEQILNQLRTDPPRSGRVITESGKVINIGDLANEDGLKIKLANHSGYDGNSRIKTANSEVLFENKNMHSANETSWEVFTSGAGAINYEYQKSAVALSVGTAAGDVAERVSTEFIPYTPGKVQAAGLTAVMSIPKDGLGQEFGIGYYREGMFFRMEGTEPVFVMRSYVTGAVVETIYPRDEWNHDSSNPDAADPLDGTGPSGIVLDVTKIQLLKISYLWQGAGFFNFSFVIDGNEYPIHQVNVGNYFDGAWIKQASLPVLYRIENTAETASASTMYEVCSEVSSEGGAPKEGYSFSADNDIVPVTTSTTLKPAFMIRLKQKFSASTDENRIKARFKDAAILTAGADTLYRMMHIHEPEYTINIGAITGGAFNVGDSISAPAGSGATAVITALGAGTIRYIETGQTGSFVDGDVVTNGVASATIAANGATVWASANDSSGLEYAVANAVTGSITPALLGGDVHQIASDYNATSAGNKALPSGLQAAELDKHSAIKQNRDSSNSEVFAIYVKTLAGTGTFYGGLTMLESD